MKQVNYSRTTANTEYSSLNEQTEAAENLAKEKDLIIEGKVNDKTSLKNTSLNKMKSDIENSKVDTVIIGISKNNVEEK